jgi:hypothetical protein
MEEKRAGRDLRNGAGFFMRHEQLSDASLDPIDYNLYNI